MQKRSDAAMIFGAAVLLVRMESTRDMGERGSLREQDQSPSCQSSALVFLQCSFKCCNMCVTSRYKKA